MPNMVKIENSLLRYQVNNRLYVRERERERVRARVRKRERERMELLFVRGITPFNFTE